MSLGDGGGCHVVRFRPVGWPGAKAADHAACALRKKHDLPAPVAQAGLNDGRDRGGTSATRSGRATERAHAAHR